MLIQSSIIKIIFENVELLKGVIVNIKLFFWKIISDKKINYGALFEFIKSP